MDQSNRGDRVLMVVVDPFLKGGVEPRVVGLLSRIPDLIHEDIDAVESRFGPLNNSIRPILGRYIAKNKFRLSTNLTDFLRNGCCPIRIPAVDDDADIARSSSNRALAFMFGRPSRRRHTKGQTSVKASFRRMYRRAYSFYRSSHLRSISGSSGGPRYVGCLGLVD
jgi:hypothetical protein